MRAKGGVPQGSIGIEVAASKLSGAPLHLVRTVEGPARQAGLPDDVDILEVDGVSTSGLAVKQAVELLRGEVGSTVRVTWRRANDPIIETAVVRKHVIPMRVKTQKLAPEIHYVRVPTFQAPVAASQLNDVLSKLVTSGGLRGLVLDLRGNGGGDPEEVAASLSLLCQPEIALWRAEGRRGIQTESCPAAASATIPLDVGIVALVDGRTAAGAEMFLRALMAARSVTVVGTPTYGVTHLGRWSHLNEEVAVSFPTERLRTPDGQLVRGPIEPTILIGHAAQDFPLSQDPALAAATRALTERHQPNVIR
ncbi:putative CtpA-like serine protease [compost metagenome]